MAQQLRSWRQRQPGQRETRHEHTREIQVRSEHLPKELGEVLIQLGDHVDELTAQARQLQMPSAMPPEMGTILIALGEQIDDLKARVNRLDPDRLNAIEAEHDRMVAYLRNLGAALKDETDPNR